MKKNLLPFLILFISTFSFSQEYTNLTFDENYNFVDKPLFIHTCSYMAKDLNGKIEKNELSNQIYTWIDWNNKVVKQISYNNKNHPYAYSEEYYNSDGMKIKEKYKSIYTDTTYIYEYSPDYSNFTAYLIENEIKSKITYGEFIKENNYFVYYEYEYEDNEISNAYKMLGPELSGTVNSFTLNNTSSDNPLLIYEYEDGELKNITKIYGTDRDEYEIVYYKDDEFISYHRIFDNNKNLIYTKSTSKWGGEYKYEYTFDKIGNPCTTIQFEINNDFSIEYFEPKYVEENKIYYSITKDVIEPTLPEVFYEYYEKDEVKISSTDDSYPKNSEVFISDLWEKAYYVDSFGDYTTTSYLRLKNGLYGTFSNSATTNSRLKVQFLIDSPNEMAIKLFEYGTSEVKGYYSDSSYYIYVKDEAGVTHMFTGKNSSDRIEISASDCPKLHKLLLENKILKFHITYQTNTSYNFTLNNDESYQKYFEELGK